MTIAERRAREEYDRRNPWRPIAQAKPGPEICELQISDAVGLTDLGFARFVLHDDGRWYQIEPPGRGPLFNVVNFRPVGQSLSKYRMRSVIAKAQWGSHEYRGGVFCKKPRRYELYWRADD